MCIFGVCLGKQPETFVELTAGVNYRRRGSDSCRMLQAAFLHGVDGKILSEQLMKNNRTPAYRTAPAPPAHTTHLRSHQAPTPAYTTSYQHQRTRQPTLHQHQHQLLRPPSPHRQSVHDNIHHNSKAIRPPYIGIVKAPHHPPSPATNR